MANVKEEVKKEEKEEVKKEKEKEEAKKSGKSSLEVVDNNGNTVRVYTRDAHGKDMEVLASSFAKKFGYKVK